jgi:tetratricopeptide (TPR) repeat protein
MRDMLQYVPKDPTKGARGYLISMQNKQLVETNKWDPALVADLEVKVSDLSIVSAAELAFFRSYLAMMEKDADAIAAEIDDLSHKIEIAKLEVGDEGAALCAAGQTRYAPNEDAIRASQVLLQQIKSFQAKLSGDEAAYEEAISQATEMEAELDFAAGPPEIAFPSFEQYGDWLLRQGRFEEALEQFETSLMRAPRRSKALQGKLAALQGLGKSEETAEIKKELESIWTMADDEVSQLIAGI